MFYIYATSIIFRMSKIKSKIVQKPISQVEVNAEPLIISPKDIPQTLLEKLTHGYAPLIIIMFLTLSLYVNTFKHQFALDDEIVICKNEFVLRGMNGIGDIFTKDIYHSFYEQMNTINQLSGGRYRPLSIASFALEQEFIGTRDDAKFDPNTIWDFNNNGIKDASEDVNKDGVWSEKDYESKGFSFRHVNNVIFYGFTICMLFVFLSQVIFKKNKLLALMISLLFMAHPIHTEVVANVKSRDEIFSLFFMLLTLWLAHQFEKKRSKRYLIFVFLSFLAAILSKEYGATLMLLVPISLYLFGDEKSIKHSIGSTFVPLFVGIIFYLILRVKNGLLGGSAEVQDSEIMNNPYLYASNAEAWATKLFIFLKYLGTIILPHPLSSDYGFNSIPYKNFAMPIVWMSIVLLIGLIIIGFYFLRKKHWIAFAIAFYLGTILLVTNLIFNVGATMGERLAFHASLGYCMVLGYGLFWLSQKLNKPQLAFVFFSPIFILYSIKTFSRNKAWENDVTLSLTDVVTMPESTALNGNACGRNLDLAEYPANKLKDTFYIKQALKYGEKAVQLNPKFVNGLMNLGVAYAKLDMLDSCKSAWIRAFTFYKSHPKRAMFYGILSQSYSSKAYKLAETKQWLEGRTYLGKALEFDSLNARLWYDFGGFSQQAGDIANAKSAWIRAFQLNPKDSQIAAVQVFTK
jgi:protein O-mannosyl-transferase